MRKFPALRGKTIVAILRKSGFVVDRQKGSHVLLKHPDGRVTVVPVHPGESIGPGLLSKILKDIEMTKEDFLKVIKGKK